MMLMILPWLRSRMPGNTALQQCNMPKTLRSTMRFQPSESVSTKRGAGPPFSRRSTSTPALLTRMSMGPSACSAAAMAAGVVGGEVVGAERLFGGGDGGVNLLLLGDVGYGGMGLPADGLDLAHDGAGALLEQIIDGDAYAFCGQVQADAAAHALARAGDEGDLAVQLQIYALFSLCACEEMNTDQRPMNRGWRFSTKARMPSSRSSLDTTSAAA